MFLPRRGAPYLQGAAFIIGIAILLRLCIGLHGYSGQGNPPMFGDYEAQRHWMEITLHTPAATWYIETAQNNLTYWGLDYPPLSAYPKPCVWQGLPFHLACMEHFVKRVGKGAAHTAARLLSPPPPPPYTPFHHLIFLSTACSWRQAISMLEPEAVALGTSHGYETESSKRLMRASVIASDFIFLIPAALLAHRVFAVGHKEGRPTEWWPLAAILIQPAAALIDHGHFQYNNIGLGLTMAASAAVASGWDCVGSVLFCLALNHKQASKHGMALRVSMEQQGRGSAPFLMRVGAFLSDLSLALKVLQRLAPIRRGLFEDYVANAWCVTHVAIKWKALFSQAELVPMCTGATLAAFLPSMLQQAVRRQRPDCSCASQTRHLPSSSSHTSHDAPLVHEKSILLPLLPVTMLAGREPYLAAALPLVASFSMFPLLQEGWAGRRLRRRQPTLDVSRSSKALSR
ncbi:uncharacterized protein LOC142356005 [Convolutriloba macropyga]|uniref:uncharacterized protein LOC142356005 n=1 Tax=Convolutriloba macropyga TaxID=536237 RepID=UPI003F51F3C7